MPKAIEFSNSSLSNLSNFLWGGGGGLLVTPQVQKNIFRAYGVGVKLFIPPMRVDSKCSAHIGAFKGSALYAELEPV